MGWVVNATPRPLYPREGDPLPIVQEGGWAPGPVWMGVENLASTAIIFCSQFVQHSYFFFLIVLHFAFVLLYNTNIHAPDGVRTSNPSKRSTAGPRLRPLGHWDRQFGCRTTQPVASRYRLRFPASHVYMYICMYVCMYVCMCIYMCVRI